MFLKKDSRILIDVDPEDALKIAIQKQGRVYYIDPDNIKMYDANSEEVFDLIWEIDNDDKIKDAWEQLEHAEEIFVILTKQAAKEFREHDSEKNGNNQLQRY